MTDREDKLADAVKQEFPSLPVAGRFEPGANQQADHVTVSDQRGGVWEISLFSRATFRQRERLLRDLAAAAERCRIKTRDRLGYQEILAFKVTRLKTPDGPGQPAKLRLHATPRKRNVTLSSENHLDK
ncbi:MAG: hypothetical protein ACJASC_003281 [Limimaricola cinnabarinus]|jgi:hypothetical protein|uniref:hypothetical protein n=1 Tax=Limimaricola cinnabarinus TaxID=1125964 RepID=UPI0039E31CCB